MRKLPKSSRKQIVIAILAVILLFCGIDFGVEMAHTGQSAEKQEEKTEPEYAGSISDDFTVDLLDPDRETEKDKTEGSILSAEEDVETDEDKETDSFDLSQVPEYAGEPYYIVNGGMPYFNSDDITDNSYITLSPLDELGRCQVAMACLGPETLPEEGEERGEIGNVKPTGWHNNKYNCVNGKFTVNRCHMIAWCLSGLNADNRNLITGTRYLNLEMLEFEEMVVRYIEETGNHVMYRATPIFSDDELMCRGLLLEGYSVEDNGKEICFNLYFYNVQPGVGFDYSTGENWYTGELLDMDSPAVVAE